MKQVAILVFGLTLLFSQATAQEFNHQFNDMLSQNDTVGMESLLIKWEKADANDPQLFVANYNYYVIKSKKEFITLGQNPIGNEALVIMDQDSTKKEPVGYIYGDISYDPQLLSIGFDWITRGIEKFPDRLDMRFGKIYLFGQLEDYETFTKEIIKTIDYSVINNNSWSWIDGEQLEDPKEFMLTTIQDFQVQLYNTGKDDLLDNMKRIAEAILKYYPDHIESLSNLAIVFMLREQYDEALEPLFKAEKLDPEDYIVLSNIAQAYKLKGDNKNATEYYKLTLKYGDEQSKQYAREQIEELKVE